MKLPFKIPAMPSINIPSAILGAVIAALVFALFTAFILTILPFLFGTLLIGALLVVLNRPTVEAKDE